MSAPPSEVPKGPERKKQKDKLKYLKPESPESPLSKEVVTVLEFLDREEDRRAIASQTLRGKKEIFEARLADAPDGSKAAIEAKSKLEETTVLLNENELRRNDLDGFRKLLFQHSNNPNVKEVSDAMNRVYGILLDTSPTAAYEGADFNNKVAVLLQDISAGGKTRVLDEFAKRNEKFDDALDAAQTKFIVEMGKTNNPNTLFEAYVTSMDRYKELADKILLLPKQERDKNIDVLLGTLSFYETFHNGEFESRVDAEMDTAVKKVLDNQEKKFKGLRGIIQKGIEKGSDFAIDHVAGILGDEGSFARNVFISAAKLGKDLSKPVEYTPELTKSIAEETKAQLKEIGTVVDKDKVSAMKKACIELKANPDRLLREEDQAAFRQTFHEFLPVSSSFIQKTLTVQSDLIQQAYVLSHGKANSEYETDSQLRGKIGNWDLLGLQGKDLFRLMQIYSPFGVFMPTDPHKKDGTPVYLRSAYQQGWFKENPYVAGLLQAAIANELIFTARAGGGFLLRLGLRMVGLNFIGRFGSKVATALNPVTNFVAAEYMAVKTVQEIKLTTQEIEIEEKMQHLMEKYPLLENVPDEEKEEVRQLFLINEIYKRKEWFGQPVGYNLSKLDVGLWKRSTVGNILEITPFTTMKETGTFREAVLSANRKLVLLGFEPYEIE